MTTTLTHRLQDERLAAGLTLIITAVGLAFANFAGNGENGGAVEYAVSVGVIVLIAAWLFGRAMPSTPRAAWILAGLALLTCAAFWSGLPFVLGIGAIYAGARAERTGPVALGAIAVALGFAGCVIG